MDYIERMLSRANTHQIAGYLAYGEDTSPESDYDTRIKEGFKKLHEIAGKDDKTLSQLNEVITVFSDVYMEIGFRAGIMFMSEVFYGTGKIPGRKNYDDGNRKVDL